MAKIGFQGILIAFLLTGLFAIVLITGGLKLAANNNAAQDLGDNPAITSFRDSLNETLSESYSQSAAGDAAISNSTFTTSTGFPVFDAIGGVWKTFKVVPIAVYNLVIGTVKDTIFGSDFSIVFIVLGAIVIMVIIFAVHKQIATGES